MAEVNVVKKSLITMQDLQKGVGTVVQTRGGVIYTLNRVSLATAVSSDAELQQLDPITTHRAAVVRGTVVTEYIEKDGAWTKLISGSSGDFYLNKLHSFALGNTLYSGRDVLWNDADSQYYIWLGSLTSPKVVPANSTPASTGGIGDSAWQPIGNASDITVLSSGLAGFGDSLVGVKQPATGSVLRTQHDKNADLVSVKDFGATGDGVADDSAAFALAIASGAALYVPPGTYVVSGLQASGRPLTFRGAGKAATIFICNDTTKPFLKLSATNATDFFDIGDFTVRIGGNPVASQQCIFIDGSSQPDPFSLYNGIATTQSRELTRGIISNINMVPVNSSNNGFSVGIEVSCLLNFNIHGINIWGPTSVSPEGIAITGAGVPVDIRMDDIYIYNVVTALMLPDYSEAIYLNRYEFVNVNTGILADYVAGRSVLTSDKCGSNAFKFGQGHINARVHCMFLNKAHFITIHDALFINQLTNSNVSSAVWLANTNWPTVHDVMCFSNGGKDNLYAVVLDATTNGKFHDNKIQDYQNGFRAIGASLNNSFTDNTSYRNTTSICVNITAATCTNNTVTNCEAGNGINLSDAGVGTKTGFRGKIVQANLVVTVAAASVTLSLDVTGVFKEKPKFAHAVALGDTQLNYHYDYANSTLTTLIFIGRLPAGGNVATGTYPYSVMAVANV